MSLPAVEETLHETSIRTGQRWHWAAIVLVVALFAFHMGTLRPGHDWGGDFSLYIMHARNLAAGQPYAETPFVYNPLFLTHSPSSYPPVYPLLLSPVYAIFGFDYTPMKVLTGLFLPLCWLFLLQLKGLSPPARLALIALSAACPIFWSFKDSVLPDIPYMAFLVLALWLNERAYTTSANEKHAVRAGLLTAAAMLVAYATRSSGLVLPVAVAGYDVIRNRKITRYAIATTAGFVVMVLALNALIARSERTYLAQMAELTPQLLVANVIDYVRSFAYIWYADGLKLAQYGMFAIAALAAAVGFAMRVWQRSSAMELFFAGHIALLIIWPGASGVRYIMPLIPIFLFYVVAGFERPALRRALPVFVALTLGIYAVRYAQFDYGPVTSGPQTPAFQELVRQIESVSAPEDLHVFWNPRVLALYTGRRSMTYGPAASAERNWENFGQQGVRYVVYNLASGEDRRVLEPIISAHASSLQLVWSNPDYALYRLQPR